MHAPSPNFLAADLENACYYNQILSPCLAAIPDGIPPVNLVPNLVEVSQPKEVTKRSIVTGKDDAESVHILFLKLSRGHCRRMCGLSRHSGGL
jgi:hypothetical protein